MINWRCMQKATETQHFCQTGRKINKNTTVLVCCTFCEKHKDKSRIYFQTCQEVAARLKYFFFPHWILASINTMASAVRTECNMQHSSRALYQPWGLKCILVQPLVKDHCYEINFCSSPGYMFKKDLSTVTSEKGHFGTRYLHVCDMCPVQLV